MKINIIGFSNLGIDLEIEAKKHAHEVRVKSSQRPGEELFSNPDMIINTIGGCAGGQFVDDPPHDLWRQNITDNISLCREFPRAKVLAFSSNAAMEPWRSPYAAIKATMEKLEFKNFQFIRVGNLYGRHKPELTFPGKLIKNNMQNKIETLPCNPIVPIPTDWFAKRFFNGHLNKHLIPSGVTTVRKWGELILGQGIKDSLMTEDRNQKTFLEGSGDYWFDLFFERIHWYRGDQKCSVESVAQSASKS